MKLDSNQTAKLLYNTKDLQNILGVGRDKAYRLMRNKYFPSIAIGGRYYVSRKALEKWIAQNEGCRVKL